MRINRSGAGELSQLYESKCSTCQNVSQSRGSAHRLAADCIVLFLNPAQIIFAPQLRALAWRKAELAAA